MKRKLIFTIIILFQFNLSDSGQIRERERLHQTNVNSLETNITNSPTLSSIEISNVSSTLDPTPGFNNSSQSPNITNISPSRGPKNRSISPSSFTIISKNYSSLAPTIDSNNSLVTNPSLSPTMNFTLSPTMNLTFKNTNSKSIAPSIRANLTRIPNTISPTLQRNFTFVPTSSPTSSATSLRKCIQSIPTLLIALSFFV